MVGLSITYFGLIINIDVKCKRVLYFIFRSGERSDCPSNSRDLRPLSSVRQLSEPRA